PVSTRNTQHATRITIFKLSKNIASNQMATHLRYSIYEKTPASTSPGLFSSLPQQPAQPGICARVIAIAGIHGGKIRTPLPTAQVIVQNIFKPQPAAIRSINCPNATFPLITINSQALLQQPLASPSGPFRACHQYW
ncbi:MAG TPA: hypothetical protein VFC07_02855, partial [Verrucomicrobiae bacterium]|nr:hypothetical protein [Verrucomicrobiae bacterium]